ncbi:phage holin family protein [Yoonia sp. BS5-3]|uniref:Phage holin family protein n=1 Tax=Yoonia phaeophyticola TaxID=3137369 RepID=A0ABZ2VBH7_9RHOB
MISDDIKNQARRLALRAARITAVAFLGLVGMGFLVATAWLAIADRLSPIAANGIVGSAFLAVAAVVFFWPKKKSQPPQVEVGAHDLVKVFLTGLNTGRSLR